jgi:hypothetical protein
LVRERFKLRNFCAILRVEGRRGSRGGLQALIFHSERGNRRHLIAELLFRGFQFVANLVEHGVIGGLGLFRLRLFEAHAEKLFFFFELGDAIAGAGEFSGVDRGRTRGKSFLEFCV